MCFHIIPYGTQKGFETIAFNDNQEKQTSPSVSRAVCFQMLSYHATCSKVEVDRLKVTPTGWCSENSKPSLTCTVLALLLVWRTDASSSPLKAAKIPLGIELGIDEFHFNDFSLDNDAMITASLRMFLDLGAVQKFKIDYEVRRVVWNAKKKKTTFAHPATPEWWCPWRFCAAGFSLWGRTTEPWRTTTGGTPSTCPSACSWWSQWVENKR